MNSILKLLRNELQGVYTNAIRCWKSQPIPQNNNGPVKIAVGDNFDELVTNSGRDAVIQFYKPKCKYCKRLAPIWEELGKVMADEDVDVIKIDAVANSFPDPYVVEYVPTTYMKFADKSKKPIEFDVNRNVQCFTKFIAKNATKELSGWDRNGNPKNDE